jgi:hypothetical protein
MLRPGERRDREVAERKGPRKGDRGVIINFLPTVGYSGNL